MSTRPVYNRGSNFIKLDHIDIKNCLEWAEGVELNEEDQVTLARLKAILKMMEKKYNGA